MTTSARLRHHTQEPGPGGTNTSGTASLWVFAGLLGVGLVLRILVYRSGWMGLDSDEATGDIMAMRGAQGHLSLVFWGGNYGGAAITWVEALLVRIFGFHFILIWLVDTAVVAGCCCALRSIARRVLTPVAASVAAGALFFFPPLWLYWSSREYVFWSTAVLFALLCGVKTLDWLESRSPRDAVLAGLLLGLTVWAYPLALGLVVPSGLALVAVLVRRRQLGLLAATAGAGVVGVAPWLIYFAIHGSAAIKTQTVATSRFSAIRSAVNAVLPTAIVGGQRRAGLIWALSTRNGTFLDAVGLTAVLGSLALLLWFVATRRWVLAGISAAAVLWPLVLAAGHVPLGVGAYRYGFIVVPPLLIEVAYIASQLRASLLLAAAMVLAAVYVSGHDTRWYAADPICLPSVQQLDAQMQREGHTRLFASYWIAADMTVCSGGKVQAGATVVSRDSIAYRAAAAQSRPVYVVFAANSSDREIKAYVDAHPGVATRRVVAGFAVWSFGSPVEPGQIQIDSPV